MLSNIPKLSFALVFTVILIVHNPLARVIIGLVPLEAYKESMQ